ncbi:MAG: hypothetical protein AAFY15_07505 [Cyanobacteria bacterium J06648_11]
MLNYFRDRYPTGSVVTDLLRVEEGIYVVKAHIEVGGTVLGCGMAGSTTVEEAEDAAISRALRAAGCDPAQLARASVAYASPPMTPAPAPLPSVSANGHAAPRPTPEQAVSAYPSSSFASDGASVDWSPPAEPEPEPELSQTTLLDEEPEDLSDIIAQSDVELKRIGWGPKEGRKYLESTFKKRSRQQLDEKELRKFLSHLKKQPTRLAVDAEEAF